MSAPSIVRVPTDQGVHSGRFAPHSRTEAGITLDGPADTMPAESAVITHRTPMVAVITDLAQDHLAGADGDLYPAFRTYASVLSDDEAAEHWSRLTVAFAHFDRFADPDTGEEAAEDALESADPAVVGNRSLSDYEAWNDADRVKVLAVSRWQRPFPDRCRRRPTPPPGGRHGPRRGLWRRFAAGTSGS